ncbi:MAG TPA: hypothetical protein PKA42_03395 [Candidatus Paceibacterota bacterium]|nr:hypothetical protein [Candidatus Paceibacterota bacterium]HMO83187.1 hypothetical protein [Candidatus Paceibacterota bacterium]
MLSPLSNFSNTLPWETLLVLGFYLIAILYIVFSAILYFHWQQYSMNAAVSKTTAILYLSTTLPLIIMMGLSTWLIL